METQIETIRKAVQEMKDDEKAEEITDPNEEIWRSGYIECCKEILDFIDDLQSVS